ncbi:multiple epidermal growth factor-like domains protein 6 [Hydractinia symbiolongicarpus]|uniref:multiple epidermal growth factor-like domains protein 6 n=1 Tax=Hydractinia symbiolongicarpus TaxID=13093 RepID=UPI002550D69E|nr:multiple epidermal growth factor-like domains protein 6 [Hydractinia symbiolongicarpus]
MDITKVLTLVFLLAVVVNCRRHFRENYEREDEMQDFDEEDELPEDYEEDELENEVEDPSHQAGSSNPNLEMCDNVNLPCQHCDSCFPGGWCIKHPGNQPKCLCNYGWTGPRAKWVPNTNDPAWGINRIRAENCLKPCHYTHHVRNKTCVAPTGDNQGGCDPKCGKYQGQCVNGKCQCCRGWSGPNGVYDTATGKYSADYCNKECPFLGAGIPNPTCKKANDDVPACNPKCVKSDGKCLTNGRCLCCLGWTGPHAEYVLSGHYKGKIVADYCDVYCPYTSHTHHKLCVNPDYVVRRREAGHRIYV